MDILKKLKELVGVQDAPKYDTPDMTDIPKIPIANYDYAKSQADNAAEGDTAAPNDIEKLKAAYPDLYVRQNPVKAEDLQASLQQAPQQDNTVEMPEETFTAKQPKVSPFKKTEIEPETNLQDLLKEKLAQSAPPNNMLANLIKAQQSSGDTLADNLYAQAGATLGNALVSRKPPADLMKEANEAAKAPVKNVQDQLAMQQGIEDQDIKKRKQAINEITADLDIKKANLELNNEKSQNDSNSEISLFGRNLIQQMTKKAVPQDVSYAQLKSLMPTLIQYGEQELKRQGMADQRAFMMNDKQEKYTEKQKEAFAKDIDLQRASARSGIGALQKQLNTSEGVRVLLNGDQSKLTDQDFREIVTNINSMIGGSTALGQLEHLDYPTYRRMLSSMMTKYTGKPVPANSPEIAEKLTNILDREENRIKNQLGKAIDFSLAKHSELRKKDPEYVNNLLNQTIYGGTGLPSQHSPSASASANAKVKVSNGKETLLIDASDLEHAKADGYNVVK